MSKLWDRRFLQLARTVASWSKDPSTKVGSVIVKDRNKVVSLGYNGYPSGIQDSTNDPREIKYLKTIHAEMNAILSANESLVGCTLYVYPFPPCPRCLSAIIQKKISRIVVMIASKDAMERWKKELDISNQMIEEYKNIKVDFYYGWYC